MFPNISNNNNTSTIQYTSEFIIQNPKWTNVEISKIQGTLPSYQSQQFLYYLKLNTDNNAKFYYGLLLDGY